MDLVDRLRLDVPVVQAGMGGGVAGSRLAGAVAAAGGLGTLGLTSPTALRRAIDEVRTRAPGRAAAVNLLMPFVRRGHVDTCIRDRIDVAVLFFGGDRDLVDRLREAGVFVLAQVGTERQACEALHWGADGLIAQGRQAGGHLLGVEPALDFLPRVLALAAGRPVMVAGGIASAADTEMALEAGASAVVAGTRFLLTTESAAHPDYKERVLDASNTVETTLFGFGWPAARHRVIENASTRRWCRAGGRPGVGPRLFNAVSTPLARVVPERVTAVLPRYQRSWLPLLAPAPPLLGMPDSAVDSGPLYAGESALRITEIISARQAVDELSGRGSGGPG
ncbi:MAG: NAD(P)H-dependent flavin oxidoreductase [Mycobacteriaceae bacterium]